MYFEGSNEVELLFHKCARVQHGNGSGRYAGVVVDDYVCRRVKVRLGKVITNIGRSVWLDFTGALIYETELHFV